MLSVLVLTLVFFNTMGGSHSSRKVTVDNENTITVSQEAMARIKTKDNSRPYYEPPPRYDSQRKFNEYAGDEAYWTRRIENLRRTHEKINSGMKAEYQAVFKQTNELFKKTTDDNVAGKLPPCQNEKSAVLQCYKSNASKTLACSGIVSAFNACVCNSRVAAVTAAH